MAAKSKTKRTSITTMGAEIQAFDIFQTPLSSHYPLPLTALKDDSSSEAHTYSLKTGRCSYIFGPRTIHFIQIFEFYPVTQSL